MASPCSNSLVPHAGQAGSELGRPLSTRDGYPGIRSLSHVMRRPIRSQILRGPRAPRASRCGRLRSRPGYWVSPIFISLADPVERGRRALDVLDELLNCCTRNDPKAHQRSIPRRSARPRLKRKPRPDGSGWAGRRGRGPGGHPAARRRRNTQELRSDDSWPARVNRPYWRNDRPPSGMAGICAFETIEATSQIDVRTKPLAR